MMDLSDGKGSGSVDLHCKYAEAVVAEDSRFGEPKSCADCRTTKTPLWRGGPSGPKSLCNACGIRYRKRREILGLDGGSGVGGGGDKGKKEKRSASSKMGVLRLLGLGRDVLLKQSSLLQLKQRRRRWRLREEEEAAVLLMSLSSGFLYA